LFLKLSTAKKTMFVSVKLGTGITRLISDHL